jgi:hypothetical protein
MKYPLEGNYQKEGNGYVIDAVYGGPRGGVRYRQR